MNPAEGAEATPAAEAGVATSVEAGASARASAFGSSAGQASGASGHDHLKERFLFRWDELPYVTRGLPGTGGTIRAEPAEFRVVEEPLYLPQGTGSHRYLLVEKSGLTTRDVMLAIMREGVEERSIGVAGLKDKAAVTVQWISVPKRFTGVAEALTALPGVKVLEESYHRNKLGIGHLKGNSFQVTIRDAAPGARARATATLAALAATGSPNWFGPQRFGIYGTNAYDGLRVVRKEPVPGGHRLNRFFVSALQSHLFNHVLAERIGRGWYETVVLGDWARKHDTGGTFLVQDAEVEGPRAARMEISATIPLFGRKVKLSPDAAGELETQLLTEYGLSWTDFTSRTGDRRISRVALADTSVEAVPGGGLRVGFALPKGSYATAVLRELMKVDVDAPLDLPEG